MREKRKKIWIDRFQTYLSLRIAFFVALYQIGVWTLVLIARSMLGPLQEMLGPAVIGPWFVFLGSILLVVALLSIYDAVKFAHRVAGPIYRFRKTIQAITAGEEVRLLTLRKGDFLQEMKEDLNEMLQVLEQRGAVVLKELPAKKEQDQPLPVG